MFYTYSCAEPQKKLSASKQMQRYYVIPVLVKDNGCGERDWNYRPRMSCMTWHTGSVTCKQQANQAWTTEKMQRCYISKRWNLRNVYKKVWFTFTFSYKDILRLRGCLYYKSLRIKYLMADRNIGRVMKTVIYSGMNTRDEAEIFVIVYPLSKIWQKYIGSFWNDSLDITINQNYTVIKNAKKIIDTWQKTFCNCKIILLQDNIKFY